MGWSYTWLLEQPLSRSLNSCALIYARSALGLARVVVSHCCSEQTSACYIQVLAFCHLQKCFISWLKSGFCHWFKLWRFQKSFVKYWHITLQKAYKPNPLKHSHVKFTQSVEMFSNSAHCRSERLEWRRGGAWHKKRLEGDNDGFLAFLFAHKHDLWMGRRCSQWTNCPWHYSKRLREGSSSATFLH